RQWQRSRTIGAALTVNGDCPQAQAQDWGANGWINAESDIGS
ncbi:MAG: hypothetical protein ACI83P_001548, partial [Janthinobacterium sp.]